MQFLKSEHNKEQHGEVSALRYWGIVRCQIRHPVSKLHYQKMLSYWWYSTVPFLIVPFIRGWKMFEVYGDCADWDICVSTPSLAFKSILSLMRLTCVLVLSYPYQLPMLQMITPSASILSVWFAAVVVQGHWNWGNIPGMFIWLRLQLILSTNGNSQQCCTFQRNVQLTSQHPVLFPPLHVQWTTIYAGLKHSFIGFPHPQVVCSLESTQGTRWDMICIRRSWYLFHSSCLFSEPLLCYFPVVLYYLQYNKNGAQNKMLFMVINKYS